MDEVRITADELWECNAKHGRFAHVRAVLGDVAWVAEDDVTGRLVSVPEFAESWTKYQNADGTRAAWEKTSEDRCEITFDDHGRGLYRGGTYPDGPQIMRQSADAFGCEDFIAREDDEGILHGPFRHKKSRLCHEILNRAQWDSGDFEPVKFKAIIMEGDAK